MLHVGDRSSKDGLMDDADARPVNAGDVVKVSAEVDGVVDR